jgi:hypothetical protein
LKAPAAFFFWAHHQMSRVSSIYSYDVHHSPTYAEVYRNMPTEMEENVPYPTNLSESASTPVRDVICGSTKIVGGCLAFPILCPLNFAAGTVMTVYGCLCCRICEPAFENRRNEYCAFWGTEAAARVSTSLIKTGASEIRRTCCVKQEMVR